MPRDIDLEVVQAACDELGRPVEVHRLLESCLGPGPHELTLLSFEQWTTSFTLRWFFSSTEPSEEIDLRLQDGLDWTVSDDLGNSYRGGDYGGGGGNSPHWRMDSWFVPKIALGAQLLSVYVVSPVDGAAIEIHINLR